MADHKSASILDNRNLHLQFLTQHGKVEALKGVSLSVGEGEIIGVVGESGSGKSVTAMSVLQILPQDKARITDGQIRFLDREILQMRERDMRHIRGREIAMIFQEPMTALNPVLSVRNQIIQVIRRHKKQLSAEEADAQALEILTDIRVPDPKRVMNSYPHELSGGLRQRVLIAMAFSSNPKLIIADEPTTALDVTIQAQILKLLTDMARKRNTAVIFISHDLAVVAQLCDRVYVMYQGEIVEHGDTRQVIQSPKHAYTKALLNAIPEGKPHKARLKTVAGTLNETRDEARPTSQRVQTSSRRFGGPLVSVSKLTVRYPLKFDFMGRPTRYHTAVDAIDLEIHEGETLSIVGESGSGKTTVAKAIVGLTPPVSGVISLNGHKMSQVRTLKQRRAMQMVFQDPQSSLNPRQRIWQIVTEPLSVTENFGKPMLKQRAEDLLEMVGMERGQINRHVHEFSGGQRQRIAIARALAIHPKLLVLDEPTSALDVSVQAQILNLLLDLQEDQNLTYLFISHDVSVVRHISDRVAVMYNGKIVEQGPATDVLNAPQKAYTKKLMESVPSLAQAF